MDRSGKRRDTAEVETISVKRAKRAAVSIATLRPLRKALGAAALLILVRTLDEATFGAYQVYYSILAFLAAAASFGISNTVARYLPTYFDQGNFFLAARIVSSARRIRFATNAIILVGIWLFWSQISSLLNLENFAGSYLIFAAVAITYLQARLLIIIFASYLMQRRALIVQAVFPLVKVLGYLFVAATGVSLSAILFVDLAASLIMLGALAVDYSARVRDTGGVEAFTQDEKRRMLRYGFFYNFNDMGQIAVGNRIDVLFIAGIVDTASAGAYALGNRLLEIVQGLMPHRLFFDVVRPLFFTLDSTPGNRRITRYFQILVKASYIFMIPATAFVAVAHKDLMDVVFGGKFREFSSLLSWLFVFASLTAFAQPLTLVLQLREKAAIILIAKLSGPLGLGALLLLVPQYGIYGAALATGCAELLRQGFQWWFVRDQATFRGMRGYFLVTILVWLLFYSTLSLALGYFDSAISRLSFATAAALSWWLIYVRLPLFNDDELAVIAKNAGPRSRKALTLMGIFRNKRSI